ncbi:DMT family transporter [Bifidobacterium aquikefiricola]|uniref:DMT family transporter n=1 Tax=Bifidobacterium aquikefiricola TaxID=3059038 RepID=A0AB39U6Y8_9BIFI
MNIAVKNIAEPERTRLSPWVARLMLLIAAATWGGGYTFSKIALDAIQVQWMMAIRLTLGSLILVAVLWHRIRRTTISHMLIAGVLLGLSYWAAFIFQMEGLRTIEPGRNAFLTATYCVLVPFLVWLIAHRTPTIRNLVAAVVCLIGIGCISLPSSGFGLDFGMGDALTMVSALLFALNLVLEGLFAKKFDALILTVYEFIVAGMLFLVGAAIFEPFPKAASFTPAVSWSMVYLIVGSTLIAQTFQNAAFSKIPSTQGSIILCTESLFGVLGAIVLVHEHVNMQTALGFVLIFCAILLSELRTQPHNIPKAASISIDDGVVRHDGEVSHRQE